MSFAFCSLGFPANSKTVRIGIYQNNPKVFVDEDGKPRGIFIDVVKEIARKENWNINYVYGDWSENLNRLEKREVDMLVDVSFSLERATKFIFNTVFVLESWLDVFSPKDVRVVSIRDLNRKKIAVLEGSVQEKYMRDEIRKEFGIDFSLLAYPDYHSCVEAVKSGIADVMVASRFFYFSPSRDESIAPSNVIFRPENLYFAFPKGTAPEFVATIDRHIVSMKNDPESAYYRSLHRWLEKRPALIPAYIKWILAVITGLLIVIGLFASLLRRQVAEKTKALHETHQLLEETQEISRLGGWDYDVRARRIKWTKEVYRLYGVDHRYDPNDISRDISFFTPECAPVIEKAFRRAVEFGEPYDLELELIRANGERIWVRSTGKPVMEDGSVIRVAGNIMDITQSKNGQVEKQRLQDRLAQGQKMELVGRLAGGVAHDFNNILTVLSGYTEMLLNEIREKPLRLEIMEMRKAQDRAASLTRQLLAFSRRQVMQLSVTNLNQVIRAFEKMLKRLIGEDIEYVSVLARELGNVKVDPGQMEQVIMNIVVNARDSMPKGGRLTIETADVTLDQDFIDRQGAIIEPGPYVMLAITDTGCGMDEATRARIFEPFFTTKAKGRGTGLGLPTVDGIVKQSGGHIEVRSEPDTGTTFKIYFRRTEEPCKTVEANESAQAPELGFETVLLVEDADDVRDLLKNALRKAGYTVVPATSGAEALAISDKYDDEIHLLLTDIVMPQMNGLELAQKIRSKRRETKVLYMSGYTDHATLRDGMLDSKVAFLQKPFTPDSLVRKLREVLKASV